MKTKPMITKEALSWRMKMNAGAFIVLLFLTICQMGSINAQDYPPGVTWIQQFGTKHIDASRGISAEGDIYVTGFTDGTLPGQNHYDPPNNPPIFDAFFAKYDPEGNQVWIRQFGTKDNDNATGVAIASPYVYVAGYTDGTLPGQTNYGWEDAFIKKYDNNGDEIWTVQFGSEDTDLPADAVGVDASGVYIAGTTWGSFPGYTNAGLRDYFLAKYSPDGTQLWVIQNGTASTDICTGIYVDASGVYICGYDNSSGNNDCFIAKYSLEGSEVWNSRFGTSLADYVQEISADETALYVSGFTYGTFMGQTNAGGLDAFAAKFDFNGNQLWIREFGTAGTENGYGISTGNSKVFISGQTTGAFPGQTNAGLIDLFIAAYDQDGVELWVMETGSNNRDYAYTISVVSPYAYVNGQTNGILPGVTGVGGSDAFLMKYLVEDLPPVADCGDDQVWIVTETVQLDGSGSSDPNGLELDYFWSFVSLPEGSSATLSNSGIVNPTFEADIVGDYQVQLIVNDGNFDSDPCMVTITVVPTPQDATLYLIADVQELVYLGVLTEDQGNGLIDKLQAAIENMDEGQFNAAINNLNAFINQVNAFYNAEILSSEQADALIAAAERIIDYLENLLLKQGGMITSMDIPTTEILTWNYPNPFNSSTTIHYTLPYDLNVTLKVFDSQGKEVSELVNGLQSSGTHSVTLNADGLMNGIYYYRLQAGTFSATKKLILLK